MAQLVREFFWIIFPVLGMGIGALAVWNEFSRQKKALEVLKVYAEKGVEPPASVLAVLNRAAMAGGRMQRDRNAWGSTVFCGVMAAGFAGLAVWSAQGDLRQTGAFVLGFTIIAFSLVAVGLGTLVTALTSKRQDGP